MTLMLQVLLVIATAVCGPQAVQPRGDSPAVFLVGSFHNNHFQERFRYSMHDLTTQVLALKPDLVCGEITPEAYQQPLEGYFPPEAVWLDQVARDRGIRFAPMDWRMDTARQNEAEAAEPARVKERARAHGEKLMRGIKGFAGTSIYDYLHGDDCLSAIDVRYEQILGENTVSDVAAGSWHERNRRMAANCLNAAAGAKRIVMVAGIDHVPQLRRQFRARGIEAQVPGRQFTPAGQGAVPAAVLARWQRNLENLRRILDGRIPVSADALLKVKGSRRIQDLEEAIRLYSKPASAGWSRADVPATKTGTQPAPAPDGSRPVIRVRVDPRIEVMGIVFRLAGYPEYSMGRVESYTKALDTHFAGYTDHPVVARARQLRKTRGISFNAPISLAVHLTNPPALAERVPLDPLPAGIDPRWTPAEARAFLVDLRSFVREARVMEFLAGHAALHQTATERLQGLVRGARIVEWLEEMFGWREDREFVLVAGLLNGGGNYGAMARGVPPGESPAGAVKVDEFFAILGTEAIDADGVPSYPPRLAATVAHEFSHSFVNPLVDAHENDFDKVASRLFPLVENRMRSQGYGVPKIVMYESLVRACTVRYLSKHLGAESARREVALDRASGFPWVGPLADTLLEYERDRSRYPTIEAFVPRVIAFFEDYSRTAADDLRAVEAEQQGRAQALSAKGPKVVSISPADRATDVDAATVTAITVTFDRPMREGNFALFPVAQAALPTLKGPPRFDASGRTITLGCELKPGVTYGLQFNSPEHMAFSDLEGNPLAPFVYRFTTRK